MNLLLQTHSLAFRAIPYLLMSKIFFEVKWNIVGGFAGVLCALGILVSPVFFILLPIPVIYSQTAIALGTLHSLLTYVGLSKQFFADHLQQEVLKVTFVRALGYVLVCGLITICLLMIYGFGDLRIWVMDPAKGFQADMIRLENGIVPISGTALGLLVGLTLMLEATMAVPMAAAAYGLGTRSHGFNGLWGLGHSWPSVLGCWAPLTILWAVLLLIMPMLFFEGSLTEAWGQMLKEQTAPPPAGAISSDGHDDGLGWTHPGILVLLLLSLLGIVATPLWAATCVIFFRTKLGDDEMEETQQVAANKERQVERQDNRRETIRSLRQQRMPSRWKT